MRRVRAELVAVHALAVPVYGSAAVGAVCAGPWTVVWFLPALLGSLVAIWCVRYGIREERPAATRAAGADDDEEERRR